MGITREQEMNLKKDLKKTIKLIIKEYKEIINIVENKKYERIGKISLINDEIVENVNILFDTTVEAYSYAPLGKDLRRNISYTMISKSLRDISKSPLNVVKFISQSYEYKFSYKWIVEFSEKMIRRLQAADKLLTSENPEAANKLADSDESINMLYKKELKTISNKIEKIKEKQKLTRSEIDKMTRGFIIAVKSFETSADKIKEIAEMSLFISTGKLH